MTVSGCRVNFLVRLSLFCLALVLLDSLRSRVATVSVQIVLLASPRFTLLIRFKGGWVAFASSLPSTSILSNSLSPPLFLLSPKSSIVIFQHIANLLKKHPNSKKYASSVASFIEEGCVRRELSDNQCFYNEHYDSLEGAAEWARDSLLLHASDERAYVYTYDQFVNSETHDPLWNAAQRQLVQAGRMHGFLRMYWVSFTVNISAI